jgi:hypothetical protein
VHQLPAGFELFDHIGGPAIKFNCWIVASVSAQDDTPGSVWSITLNLDRPIARRRSAPCRCRAERYVVAWVKKWETNLREMYRQPPARASGPAESHLRPSREPRSVARR